MSTLRSIKSNGTQFSNSKQEDIWMNKMKVLLCLNSSLPSATTVVNRNISDNQSTHSLEKEITSAPRSSRLQGHLISSVRLAAHLGPCGPCDHLVKPGQLKACSTCSGGVRLAARLALCGCCHVICVLVIKYPLSPQIVSGHVVAPRRGSRLKGAKGQGQVLISHKDGDDDRNQKIMEMPEARAFQDEYIRVMWTRMLLNLDSVGAFA